MKLLAIDTSSSACSVALSCDDEITVIHEIAPMQQAQTILTHIDNLLRERNLSLNQLNALAFGRGPGSFTGVRIATSVMQGLGYAANLPLIPISSLAALAQSAYQDLGWMNLIAATDARIQEIYWGAYQVNAAGLVELVGKEHVCAPDGLLLPDNEGIKGWYGVGNAWSVYHDEILYAPLKIAAERMPNALGVLTLAKNDYLQGRFVKPEEALPTYLRDSVAKKSYLYLDPKER